MNSRAGPRAALASVVALVALAASAAPAAAHGVGGRTDLPIPAWQLAWAASLAVAASFVALGMLWTAPRLAPAATGTPLARTAQRILPILGLMARLLGISALGLVIYGGLWGNQNPSVNLAPIAFFILFWVGVQIVSVALGDVWPSFNPFHTLADVWVRARAVFTGAPVMETVDIGSGSGHQWWATGAIFSFAWLELAFHGSDSPRSIGVYLALYTVAMVGGAAVRGRGWVRDADGFGVLFTKIGAMAPLYRDRSGIWRRRSPLAGLSVLPVEPGTVAFILVVLGSTSFDGFTRSSIWLDIVSNRSGWELTTVNTVGLVFVIGVVMAVYRAAIVVTARLTGNPETELANSFASSLVPIVVAYTVAHYFSYLVLEGQALYAHLSDPFGRGWDLFGTAGYRVNYTWISTEVIAWIQTTAIAAGHVLAVAVAHDRALEIFGPHRLAVRSQYPILVAMIGYTVAGLFLLLGA